MLLDFPTKRENLSNVLVCVYMCVVFVCTCIYLHAKHCEPSNTVVQYFRKAIVIMIIFCHWEIIYCPMGVGWGCNV